MSPASVFLLRAAVAFDQAERGEVLPEEAVLKLAPAFYDLVHVACPCARDIFHRLDSVPHIPTKPKFRRAA